MIKKHLGRISLISLMILLTSLQANSQGKFSNAITNVDLNKSSDGLVKVNIYTKNPYGEKVIINKKPDNKYVILLPETDNWMSAKPSVNTVDAIKTIDVKTQASNNPNGKGYTKIVIESKKPVEIVPQTLVYKAKSKEDIKPAETPQKIVEKAVPISTEPPVYTKKAAAAPIKTAFNQQKKPFIRTQQKQVLPKVMPIEIVDLPQPQSVTESETSDSFLLVQKGEDPKVQVKEENKSDISAEDLSKALMKESPKELSAKSKIHFKFFKKLSLKKLMSWEFNIKLLKIAFKSLLVLGSLGLLVYFLYGIFGKKNKVEKLAEATASSIENEELKKAIEEFEQVEESTEKLEPKPYIKNIDAYKNLDGFKKEEVSSDILKTLDAIQKGNKTLNPLDAAEENKLVSYNYNNDKYLFKSPMEELTEDEEKALFDEDDEVFDEDETLSSQYYNNSDEIFIVEDEKPKDEFFIVEDDEDEEILDEIDEELAEEELQEAAVEEVEEIQEPVEPEPDVENLKLKVKYEISDGKGISLVKYHDVTALFGYIGSNITLLKKFEDAVVPEELSVRLSEQVDENTQHYIVKVGNYKGLVEVKPLTIRLLLNL